MTNMKRTLFCLALLSASLSPVAYAQEKPTVATQGNPWIQVKSIPSEEHIVRAYFSPNCSFSKNYFSFFKNLSVSLEAQTDNKFEYSPVVNRGDGIEYSLAFAAVKRYYPKFVMNFVQASMEGAQDRMIPTNTWAGIDRIGKAARIPVPVSKLVFDNRPTLQKDVLKMVNLQAEEKITNTPSVAVNGTYIVTPEFVNNGDPQQFSMLINAVISYASGK